MQLEEATFDQIVDELRSRPIRFAIAAIEETPEGDGWVRWSADQTALDTIRFLILTSRFLEEVSGL